MNTNRSRVARSLAAALAVVLALVLALVLSACGGGGASDDKAAGTRSAGGVAASEPEVADAVGADRDSTVSAKLEASTAVERSVIATGSLRLTSKHLADARQDAINLVTGLGGHVANEQSQSDDHGRLDRVDLSLRVPAASFDKALDGLAALGTVRHREQSVEDVTTQVIDVAARVKTQRASVENIERLLARATTIGEIMSIERQLATRQAELDSLEQQQKWLADQTSLSTVQLTVDQPSAGADDDGDAGFLSGLEDGWHALGRTALAIGTAVGAVLPFAVVLAVIGVPVWLLVRRRRPVTTPPPVAES